MFVLIENTLSCKVFNFIGEDLNGTCYHKILHESVIVHLLTAMGHFSKSMCPLFLALAFIIAMGKQFGERFINLVYKGWTTLLSDM